LLTDPEFRSQCLERVSDPLVRQSFASYEQLRREQVQAAGSTLRRAFLLSFSPLTRYSLGQPDNVLDFRSIMDEGRSIIINLGNINDQETRKLVGAMLMVQIEQAALSRTDLSPSARTPFTLLVDEWDSFAAQATTIRHILSQARKYQLRLYLAGQSLSQVSADRLAGALGNCKVQIAFGLGRDSAEIQARHIGFADPYSIKEAAPSDAQHNQFMNIPEQFEAWTQELQDLPPRAAYVKLEGQRAVRIRTLPVPSQEVAADELEQVLATYRSRYQRTREQAEQATSALFRPQGPASPGLAAAEPPVYTRLFQGQQRDAARPTDEETTQR